MSFPHMLIRVHRYSIKILLEAVETGSFVKVFKFVGTQWACCKGTSLLLKNLTLLLHSGSHLAIAGSLHAKRSMCCTQMT